MPNTKNTFFGVAENQVYGRASANSAEHQIQSRYENFQHLAIKKNCPALSALATATAIICDFIGWRRRMKDRGRKIAKESLVFVTNSRYFLCWVTKTAHNSCSRSSLIMLVDKVENRNKEKLCHGTKNYVGFLLVWNSWRIPNSLLLGSRLQTKNDIQSCLYDCSSKQQKLPMVGYTQSTRYTGADNKHE